MKTNSKQRQEWWYSLSPEKRIWLEGLSKKNPWLTWLQLKWLGGLKGIIDKQQTRDKS